MSIFDKWLNKKQIQPKTEIVLPVEPERPKTIIDVGWDVVYEMEQDEEKRKKLYNSLEREERILLGRGSLFVSGPELDYFFKVTKQLGARPVILIDFEKTESPGDDLLKVVKEYEDKPEAPIVFVKNYFQDMADKLDPRSDFDHLLRGRVQNAGWVAVIHGGRHAPGLSGNIAGSSRSTQLFVEEIRVK